MPDEQPKTHEIGKRTYIVADVEPLDVDGTRTVAVGTALWLLGFLVLLPFYGRLEEDDHAVVDVDLPRRLRPRAVRLGPLPTPPARQVGPSWRVVSRRRGSVRRAEVRGGCRLPWPFAVVVVVEFPRYLGDS